MTIEKKTEGFDELTFELTDPNPVDPTPKLEVDPTPEPEPAPEPQPVPEPKKKGRVKKEPVAEPEPAPAPEPEPEPDPELEEENDGTLYKGLAERLGIELDEADQFEETEEGLSTFVQTVSDRLADAKLNGWLESLPPVATDFFDYLQMLGNEATEDKIKQFFTSVNPEVDYKTVDLNNEDAQKAVLRTFYKKAGYSEEESKEMVEDFEVAGTLKKYATSAAAKLAAAQETDRQKLLNEQKEADLKKKENIKKYWETVEQTINTGKVHNFNIPGTERKGLHDYMSKPTKSGTTQLQEDLNAMSVEDRIALAIAIKNKFNLSKYISAAAKTQTVSTLRDKLKGVTPKMKGGNPAHSSDDIVFDIK